MKLATNFGKISNVRVITDVQRIEQEELELKQRRNDNKLYISNIMVCGLVLCRCSFSITFISQDTQLLFFYTYFILKFPSSVSRNELLLWAFF